jgi:hypothetical protein
MKQEVRRTITRKFSFFSLFGVPSHCELTTLNGTVFSLKIVTHLKTQKLSVNQTVYVLISSRRPDDIMSKHVAC